MAGIAPKRRKDSIKGATQVRPAQFTRASDPHAENKDKTRPKANLTAKTMKVERGKGLPKAPERHLHHRHNAARTKRAR